jgi:hypothetical protein
MVNSEKKERLIVVDAAVGHGHKSPLLSYIDNILDWVTKTYNTDEIAKAKEEFYWKTGKVFSDDDLFSSRMDYFTNYFLFQRNFDSASKTAPSVTPFQAYLQHNQIKESQNIIAGSRHSLYQIAKIGSDHLILADFFTEERLLTTFAEGEVFHAFNKKDIFQGFLFLCQDKLTLGKGLVFHPSITSSLLKKHIKNARKSDDFEEIKILFLLARKQLKHFRHPNIPPKQLYSSHQV